MKAVGEYKGVNFSFDWSHANRLIDYYIDGKMFPTKDEMIRYIDKVILRKKKLERLRLV